jgi:hypothetical protein
MVFEERQTICLSRLGTYVSRSNKKGHFEEGKTLTAMVLTHTVVMLLIVGSSLLVHWAVGLQREPHCIERSELTISVKGAPGTPNSAFELHQVIERCK